MSHPMRLKGDANHVSCSSFLFRIHANQLLDGFFQTDCTRSGFCCPCFSILSPRAAPLFPTGFRIWEGMLSNYLQTAYRYLDTFSSSWPQSRDRHHLPCSKHEIGAAETSNKKTTCCFRGNLCLPCVPSLSESLYFHHS